MSEAPVAQGLTLTSADCGIDRLKVWAARGEYGSFFRWGWRYFQARFGLGEQWWKRQTNASVWASIAGSFGLPCTVFDKPDAFRFAKGPLVETVALVPMFMSLASRPGPSQAALRAAARQTAVQMIEGASAGLSSLQLPTQIEIGGVWFTLHEARELRRRDVDVLHALKPDFVRVWDHVAPQCNLPPVTTARLSHMFVFTERLRRRPFFQMEVVPRSWVLWAERACQRMVRLVGVGLERHVVQALLPMGHDVVPRPLFGPRGRRRSVDEAERMHQLSTTAKRKGARTAILAAVGHGNLGFETMVTSNRVYDNKRANLFRGERNVSVTWDPGTYSGEQTNVGLFWGIGRSQGCHMQCKVRVLFCIPSYSGVSPEKF